MAMGRDDPNLKYIVLVGSPTAIEEWRNNALGTLDGPGSDPEPCPLCRGSGKVVTIKNEHGRLVTSAHVTGSVTLPMTDTAASPNIEELMSNLYKDSPPAEPRNRAERRAAEKQQRKKGRGQSRTRRKR